MRYKIYDIRYFTLDMLHYMCDIRHVTLNMRQEICHIIVLEICHIIVLYFLTLNQARISWGEARGGTAPQKLSIV